MPSWKKVIISGSAAELSSVFAPSITGSLQGTASFALTASVSLASTANQILVLNQSGYTISKGIVVHITGSNTASDIPRIVSASYESDLFSANTLGIASETITNGSQGYITTEGVLSGVNTSAFISGQIVYLGAAGSITGSAPIAPLHSVRLGQVVREQSVVGSIYVRIDNGYELGELHDITDTTTTTSYGDLLVKSGSVWRNSKQLTGTYGITGSLEVQSTGANGIVLEPDLSGGTNSSRLFFVTTGSYTDFSIRNTNQLLLIAASASAGVSSGTGRMYISASGVVSIGPGYSPISTRNAILQLSGSVNIEEGFAYKQDGFDILYTTRGTIGTTYDNIIGGVYAASSSLVVNALTAYGYLAAAQSSGSYQTIVGHEAGRANTGSYQTLLGWYAGTYASGDNQTAIGRTAGYNNTSTSQTAVGYSAGYFNTGSSQSAFGALAGQYNTGSNQTAIGREAGTSNSGASQTATGYQSGYGNIGSNQTATGNSAGYYNDGDFQTAIGGIAGYQNTGSNQSAFGYSAGYQNSGSEQTAVGVSAGYLNKGDSQTATGYQAGLYNSSSYQSAFGRDAGRNQTGSRQSVFGALAGGYNKADYQSAFGYAAGQYNSGSNQTAVGYQAGQSNSGSNQTVVGVNAGRYNSASFQTAVGMAAGYQNAGTDQSAFGYYAGYQNTGSYQATVGSYAGYLNLGSNQTAMGANAGAYNSGSYQTAFGYAAGTYNSSSYQVAIGSFAGYLNRTSIQTAVGVSAGQYNSGSNQTALGYVAGYSNSSNAQTVVGFQAGQYNSASNQTAVGSSAGQYNSGSEQTSIGASSGWYNSATRQTAVGASAGSYNSGDSQTVAGYAAGYLNSGSNQTAMGANAGRANSGSDNSNFGYNAGFYVTGTTINSQSAQSVFIGSSTKAGVANATNQIVIGYDATGIGSNSVVLGNSSISTTSLRGNVGMGTDSPTSKLDIVYTNTGSGVLVRGGGGALDSTALRLWDLGTAANNRNIIEFGHNTTYVTASRIYSTNPSVNATTGGKLVLETTSNNIGTFNNDQLVLSNNGNVGIGTDSPIYTLQIQAAPTASIRLQETGSGGNKRLDLTIDGSGTARISANQSSQNIAFDTVNNERLRITSTGNIGIGTSTPLASLHTTGSAIISGSMIIGSSSLGPSENTLTLGARDSANEGGQLGFNAPGGTYTSASMIDLYQNRLRILRGTNAGSTGEVASYNLHTLQMSLPAYTSATSFTGTVAGILGFDVGGNIITTSPSGLSGGATNYLARWLSATSLTTGSVFDNGTNVGIGNQSPSYKLDVTGDIRATGAIYANANGAMYFQGGDDAALYDINAANTMGIYGVQTVTEGAIKLGSDGAVLYGSGSKLGIGTTNPNSASLHVNGNVFATSFTGSLQGTASYDPSVIQTTGSSIYSVNPSTANFSSQSAVYLGVSAGRDSVNTFGSVFIGNEAGINSVGSNRTVAIGQYAAANTSGSLNSVFIGLEAGSGSVSSSYSNFIGLAGQSAKDTIYSNFIGAVAGEGSNGLFRGNIIGFNAGFNASGSYRSNWFGQQTGQSTTSSYESNFIGYAAGYENQFTYRSNFIGFFTGYRSTGSHNSNFFGSQAGRDTANADNSIFIGTSAGRSTSGSEYCTLLGYQAGYAVTTNSIGSNNVIIGTNITLASGSKDSINIGGIIFGTGSYSTTTGNPSSGSVANGRIGIGVTEPQATLDVSGSFRVEGTYESPSGNIIDSNALIQAGLLYLSNNF